MSELSDFLATFGLKRGPQLYIDGVPLRLSLHGTPLPRWGMRKREVNQSVGRNTPVNRIRMCKFIAQTGGIAVLSCGLAIAQMQQPGSSPSQSGTPMPGANDPTANPPSAMAGQGTSNATPNTMADKDFVKEALQGGMAEVQMGQLALQKSNNEQIKQFAQKMVNDHAQMGEQMKPVAQQLGVKEPSGPSKKDKETIAKLQNLNGDAFDKAYVQTMLKDHKHDAMAFKREAESGSDPNVKQAAAQGEQIITAHLQLIQQIAKSQGVTGKGGE
jgi:putative membrane protein